MTGAPRPLSDEPYMEHKESQEMPGWCGCCFTRWPCSFAEMAEEVDRLSAALEAVTGERDQWKAAYFAETEGVLIDPVATLVKEGVRLKQELAGAREALETFADLAQLVFDRITNGVTNNERYLMKDAARIAMDQYRALAPAADAPGAGDGR
ncbi:MAG TPA: hypothetical protein VMT30_09245 [Candidatus Saccharimonadia bacterium]|nr:hypothetical protein [Candidatus Saccharimonadia bacterium]